MFDWFHNRRSEARRAETIYDAIVTAARRKAFYRGLGIPDSLSGRYEMLVLHLFLVIERLRTEGREGATLSRAVTERFVVDMDDCLREIGVGDLSVPKKVQSAAAGLFERVTAYRAGLGEADPALAQALARFALSSGNVGSGEDAASRPETGGAAEALAAYVRDSLDTLSRQPLAELLEGPTFPPPETFSAAASPSRGSAP